MVTLSSNFAINLQLKNAITGDADKKMEYSSQTNLYISGQGFDSQALRVC